MPYAAAIALRYRYCRLFESHELSMPDKRPDTGSDIGICSRRSGSDDVESTHTASQTQHSVLTQFDATLRTLSSEHSVRRNTENTQFSVLRLTRSVSGLYIIALHANIGVYKTLLNSALLKNSTELCAIHRHKKHYGREVPAVSICLYFCFLATLGRSFCIVFPENVDPEWNVDPFVARKKFTNLRKVRPSVARKQQHKKNTPLNSGMQN